MLNANNRWHFKDYEQEQFQDQLSFITSGPEQIAFFAELLDLDVF